MTDAVILQRIRTALQALCLFLFVGTCIELVLAKHTEDPAQWIPFVLCALGAIAIVVAWRSPTQGPVLFLRGVMTTLVLGSLLGVYFHVKGNYEFVKETNPDATQSKVITSTLIGGAPLLAPGVLSMIAAIAFISSYSLAKKNP